MLQNQQNIEIVPPDRSIYVPGRFQYLMEKPFASEMWNFLATAENIALMISATEEKKTAIAKLILKIEEKFAAPLSSKEYPQEEVGVFINNMIKQIMEHFGYSHVGCGLCPGRYIRASGLYEKEPGV